MPRKERIHYPNAVYHVIIRGNYRQNIFFIDNDRYMFYKFLSDGLEKYKCKCHCFCLMTNHIHMIIQVKSIPLSQLMQNIGFRFSRYTNKNFRRSGHLFQSRYQAIIVNDEEYFLQLCRYIHLNPLRANMIAVLDDYPWSSHHSYTGRNPLHWVTTKKLEMLLKNRSKLKLTYKKFIKKPFDFNDFKPILELTSEGKLITRNYIINQFNKNSIRLQKAFIPPSLDKITSIVCKALEIHKFKIFEKTKNREQSLARAMISYFSREYTNIKLDKLANYFNRHPSSISNSISKLKKIINKPKIKFIIEKIKYDLEK